MSGGHDDFAVEPVPGLPEPLPAGESLLWQGAPSWRCLARRAFHTRKLVVYFLLLAAWRGGAALAAGEPALAAGASAAWAAVMGGAAVGLLVLLAWLSARSTLYTLTDRRLVLRFGVALPMTVNVPFEVIESAAVKQHADGTGDIPVRLTRGSRVGYLVMWPHVRPWCLSRPEPMLRALPEADRVAGLLAGALRGALGAGAPAPAANVAGRPADQMSGPLAGAAA